MKINVLQFISKYTALSVGIVLLWGCLQPPNYSNVPKIEFKNLHFIDVTNPALADSLVVSVGFEDGDGDLGLNAGYTGTVFHNGEPLYFAEKIYPTNDLGERITYAYKRENPTLNLPDYVKPYNCINWEITAKKDTVYFVLNKNHYNIFVDFYVKQNDGSFELFDWREKFCSTFNGRFPVLSKDLSNPPAPLEGTIHYSMTSVGFKIQFSLKILKLKIHIQDRLQQKSNEIETPEFQFR